jgi:hypothetical protein
LRRRINLMRQRYQAWKRLQMRKRTTGKEMRKRPLLGKGLLMRKGLLMGKITLLRRRTTDAEKDY